MRTGSLLAFYIFYWGAVHANEPVPIDYIPMGLPSFYKFTDYDPKLIGLGKKLFESNILSRNRNISCVSCHSYTMSTSDQNVLPFGTHGDLLDRNSPAIINNYYFTSFMYDGAAKSIEQQVVLPLESLLEMDLPKISVLKELNSDPRFIKFYSCLDVVEIDYPLVVKSLSTFVSSLVSGNSRFDMYLYGSDETSLNLMEKSGFELFRGKASCTSCHKIDSSFATFTDNGFHNLGVGFSNNEFKDNGRFEVTGHEIDKGKFKTPSLRNISKTSPYMHDGSIKTLIDVVNFYNDGGVSNPNLDRKVKPLDLTTEEKEQLVSFLMSLDSELRLYIETSNKCID